MSIEFKVGQIWETRNEKARGVIESVAEYATDYPIKLTWHEPLPDFVAERPKKLEDSSWDLFRADGGLNFASADPKPSEWDLVRLVQPDAIPVPPAAEPLGVYEQWEADQKAEQITDMAYDFAKIGAKDRPDLGAEDIVRCAFDMSEAFVAEQIKRGYRK
jgi:hypothetical protein